MHLTRHRLAKTVILLLVMAVFGLALSSARTAQVHAAKVRCSASLTYVPNVPVICEQIRYVRETLRLPYQDYVARANGFRFIGYALFYQDLFLCRQAHRSLPAR
jgi:hypothetical protein